MQTKSATIRVQTLEGTWETLGVERLRGVWPENDSYTADEWGSSKCSMDLHRDPGTQFPDLSSWTPCEVEIGGLLVWSGRIIETPDQEASRVLNVQGKGWQYHLDDDQYDYKYVHARLTDYKDLRAMPTAALTVATAAYSVQVGDGAIVIQAPKGAAIAQNTCGGVILDFGPTSGAKALAVDFEMLNGTANWALYARGSNIPDPLGVAGVFEDFFSLAGTTGSGTGSGVVVTARRYVSVWWYRTGVGGVTANDEGVRITGIRTFADSAWLAGNQSVLKSTDVVRDALQRATILLSDDGSLIDPDGAASFAFPEFALDGQKTPREVWTAANAAEGWRAMIDVYRRPVFSPKPTAPLIEIGAWAGSELDGGGSNGEEIYNRVIVEGTAADGSALKVVRAAAQQAGADVIEIISTPSISNPSFAVNASGWPFGVGSITRDTVNYDTAPASGAWAGPAGSFAGHELLYAAFTGTFRKGVTYVLDLRYLQAAGDFDVTTYFGDAFAGAVSGDWTAMTWSPSAAAAGWHTLTMSWTPTANRTAAIIGLDISRAAPAGTNGPLNIDSVTLGIAKPTLIDRRGFRRTHTLPARSTLTTPLAEKMADVWLGAHRTTPMKGAAKITGNQAAREILTGAGVAPERLLLMTNELLRLSHRVDPDTGAHGRDGRLAEVTYTPLTDTAAVAIDNRRTSHEALLERLAVVVGS